MAPWRSRSSFRCAPFCTAPTGGANSRSTSTPPLIDSPLDQTKQKIYGNGKIVIHERPGKLGLGTAYINGLQRARAPFVVLMDADLSHHPKFIPEMYRWGSGDGGGLDPRRISLLMHH